MSALTTPPPANPVPPGDAEMWMVRAEWRPAVPGDTENRALFVNGECAGFVHVILDGTWVIYLRDRGQRTPGFPDLPSAKAALIRAVRPKDAGDVPENSDRTDNDETTLARPPVSLVSLDARSGVHSEAVAPAAVHRAASSAVDHSPAGQGVGHPSHSLDVPVPVVPERWKDDPTGNEAWNAGCDFAMKQLCAFMGVEPATVTWDAATETVDGDVQAVIGNIIRAKMGEDWSPSDAAPAPPIPTPAPTIEQERAWWLKLEGIVDSYVHGGAGASGCINAVADVIDQRAAAIRARSNAAPPIPTPAPMPKVREAEARVVELEAGLRSLADAVGHMRVPQTLAEAALQVSVTIGPALAHARELLADPLALMAGNPSSSSEGGE